MPAECYVLIPVAVNSSYLWILSCKLKMSPAAGDCRMLVGVGEASFVALAAPFIGKLGKDFST